MQPTTGDSSITAHYTFPRPSAAIVLGLSALKGALIVLDYMELRHAPALWRRLLLGWLAVVVVLLLAASAWHAR